MGLHRLAVPVLLATAFVSAPAFAEPLTCAMFRERLDGALLATGQKVDAITFTPGFTNPKRGTRYDYASGSLSGTLGCGPADEFQEFGIELRFRKGDVLADDLKQLMTVEGASLCALTEATAPTCNEFGRAMLEAALSQMGAASSHGVRQPAGLSEKTLFGTLHVSLAAAPTLITFLVGSIVDVLDAARQPLPVAAQAPPAASE